MSGTSRSAAQGIIDLPVHSNEEYDWDLFRSQLYFEHNYAEMRKDDARMLAIVRDWFAKAVPDHAAVLLDGIDVGSGANLYPALALLPYCDSVTLYEYSRENVGWLESAIKDLPESWLPFCDVLAPEAGDPRQLFELAREQVAARCRVKQGSIFELASARWEIGTMFFCADSLTEDLAEFDAALGRFVGALKPGAPFAAAFMENSEGYEVGGTLFPAVSIDAARLTESFQALGTVADLEVCHVDVDPAPIRPGYTGYLVAIGKVKD